MLHAIAEYARTRALDAEPGFATKRVRWALVFGANGGFSRVCALGPDGTGERISKCPDLSPPEIRAGGPGCRHFLVDNLAVLSLWTKGEEIDEKLEDKHGYWTGLLTMAAEVDPALGLIAASLDDPAVLARIRDAFDGDAALATLKPSPTDLATIILLDGRRFVESEPLRDWWRAFRGRLVEKRLDKKRDKGATHSPRMRCLLTGELVEPTPTHPAVRGLAAVGGLATGDFLVSSKQASFRSFDSGQGRDAPMSDTAAATYATGLSELIANNSERLVSHRIAYWYDVSPPAGLDPVQEVLTPVNPSPGEAAARSLVLAIRDAAGPARLESRYTAIVLNANSGRVVIRDWMEGRLESIAAAVDDWFADLEITARDGTGPARRPKFMAILGSLGWDLDKVPAAIEAGLWRAAVGGRTARIPEQAAAAALAKIRTDVVTDEAPRHERYAVLRAFLIRNREIPMPAVLDIDSDDPPYVAGRILAILARIQKLADPKIDVGLAQRYYGGASTTPALILGRLQALCVKGHLPKIYNTKLRGALEAELEAAWSKLATSPSRAFTLEEQTRFALGYYHQRAYRRPDVTDAAAPAA